MRMEWAAGIEGLTNPCVQASDALTCVFCHFSCIQFRFLVRRTFRQAQAVSLFQFVEYHSDIVEFSSRWYDAASLGNRIATFRFAIVVSFSGMEISKKKRKFLPLKLNPLRCLASNLWYDRVYQKNRNIRVQVYCTKTNAKAVSSNERPQPLPGCSHAIRTRDKCRTLATAGYKHWCDVARIRWTI